MTNTTTRWEIFSRELISGHLVTWLGLLVVGLNNSEKERGTAGIIMGCLSYQYQYATKLG